MLTSISGRGIRTVTYLVSKCQVTPNLQSLLLKLKILPREWSKMVMMSNSKILEGFLLHIKEAQVAPSFLSSKRTACPKMRSQRCFQRGHRIKKKISSISRSKLRKSFKLLLTRQAPRKFQKFVHKIRPGRRKLNKAQPLELRGYKTKLMLVNRPSNCWKQSPRRSQSSRWLIWILSLLKPQIRIVKTRPVRKDNYDH